MKAFVINLERVPERREYMSEQLKLQKLDFEFIKATDYKELSDSDVLKLVDHDSINKNRFFTKGVLACALSHLEAYRRMIEEDLDLALILEDDVYLSPDINEVLSLIEKEIHIDEVISLIYFAHSGKVSYLSTIGQTRLNDKYSLTFPVDIEDVGCAMAYVITKQVAIKMLNIAFPVLGPADYWGSFFRRGVFSSFRCVAPFTVNVAPFRTTIDYASSKTITSKLAAIVRRYKIPFLYRYLQMRENDLLARKSFIFNDKKPFISDEPS